MSDVNSEFAPFLSIAAERLADNITFKILQIDGLNVLEFTHEGFTATVGCGFTTYKNGQKRPFATVYGTAEINRENLSSAKYLMRALRDYFKGNGYSFAIGFCDTVYLKHLAFTLRIRERETATGLLAKAS